MPKRKRIRKRIKGEFVCSHDDCDKSYTSSAHLKRHADTHSGNIRCIEENCGKIFKSFSTLSKHIDNVHLKMEPKKYKCSFCDEEFNKHNWLTRHQFKHTGVKPYMCPEDGCKKRFLVPSKLKRHMKVHDGYTCSKENCGKTFPKWTLLTKHIVLAHPTIHKCQHCGKQFSRSNNLKAHLEIHQAGREVFECPKPDCSRFYTLKRNLDHHIRSYHDKRPFVCPQEHCHKAFKSETDMIAHKKRHDPNKRIRRTDFPDEISEAHSHSSINNLSPCSSQPTNNEVYVHVLCNDGKMRRFDLDQLINNPEYIQAARKKYGLTENPMVKTEGMEFPVAIKTEKEEG